MTTQNEFEPMRGARWAIGRKINGTWISIVERSSLFKEDDAAIILAALLLPIDEETLDRYFPKNSQGERCPTFELTKLFYYLDTRIDGPRIGV